MRKWCVTLLVTAFFVGAASFNGLPARLGSQSSLAQGKKCECSIIDDGDARCFFDGSRCPVSGGKCNCFKSPVRNLLKQEECCLENKRSQVSSISVAATEFCEARCPVKVGGETCGAQCRLKEGHSGNHLCIKLHNF